MTRLASAFAKTRPALVCFITVGVAGKLGVEI